MIEKLERTLSTAYLNKDQIQNLTMRVTIAMNQQQQKHRLRMDNSQSQGQGAYNHATTNLAIYSNETVRGKNRQSIIVIQVRDKLHENLFNSTCSFH